MSYHLLFISLKGQCPLNYFVVIYTMKLKEFYAKTKKQNDDYVSRVARAVMTKPLAFLVVKYTSITPNQITVLSIFPGVASLVFLALGGKYTLLGAFLFFLYGVLDGVDGIVARATERYSKQGQWLDGIIGFVLVPLTFLATGIGLGGYNSLLIGAIASLCFPIQFVLIHYFKSEIVQRTESLQISASGKLEFVKYIYGVALYYYLLLFGALFHKMIYVLLFFAVFGTMFWMGTIVVQYLILRREKKL